MYFGSKRKSAARRLKLRDRIISMLLAVSLLCGNPIVLPTGAAEVAYCGIEEHSHSEECYATERVLTCGVTQENHVHSEACKQTEKTLTCTIVEQVHEHTDACYTTTTNLTCTKHVHTADCARELTCTDTTEGHAHTDACYAYTCDSPNSTHQHTDSCYTTESVLNCDFHQHTDDCYTTTEVNTCGVTQENHTHSDACYGEQKTLSCTRKEHTHTSACYSNPEADLETAEKWEDTLPKEDKFTGTWAKDLLAVAESQLDYTESVQNYQVAEDGKTLMGYNRYGAWYASVSDIDSYAYAPWNVTFLFFDLYHCGISFMDFPYEEDCAEWVKSLDDYDLYRGVGKTYPVSEEDTEGEAYTPNPGDLVFTDTDGDGEADRAGIVSEVTEDKLTAIEGDYEGTVAAVTYDLPELTAEAQSTEAAGGEESGISISQSSVMLLSDDTAEPEPTVLGYADMTQAQENVDPGSTSAVNLASWNTGDKLYLDLSEFTDWASSGAEFALFYRDSNANTHMTLMSKVTGTDYLYYIKIPSNMQVTYNFRIVRKDSTVPIDGAWWNATDELTLPTDGNNCYKINAWGTAEKGTNNGYWSTYDDGSDDESESVDTLPKVADGCRRVFYDATLSKLSYEGDADIKGTPIPASDGGVIYYYDYTNGSKGKMTKLSSYTATINGVEHTWTDVYFADVSANSTTIAFAAYELSDSNLAWSGNSTGKLSIGNYINPCFYADTSDSSIYGNYSGNVRGGYWGEAFQIRDAEAGKTANGNTKDVVDINAGNFVKESDTLYINSTFYDYYTDYELNGTNRDGYGTSTNGSYRNWYTFRHFNQALSDYYAAANVKVPLYTGQFQPKWKENNEEWGLGFHNIYATLNLYGYDVNNQAPFMSVNNSTMDINADGGKYDYAAQGLVSATLENGQLKTAYGETLLPHFNADFINGNNSKNAQLGQVYENVSFPFTKQEINGDGVEYWVFDSAKTTLEMKQDSGKYYLEEATDATQRKKSINVNATGQYAGAIDNSNDTSDVNGDGDKVSTKYGFFPFNEGSTAATGSTYNYGFGCKLEFNFRLTSDGTVEDKDGNPVPIQFQFSGDDDVWVFIDNQLVLDVGGDHGRVTGTIYFATGSDTSPYWTVSNVKASPVKTGSTSGTFSIDTSKEHTLTMYYMERGMWESNMKLTFNFPDENLLVVKKQVDTSAVDEMFEKSFEDKDLFTFNIKTLATHFGTKAASAGGTDQKTAINVDLTKCSLSNQTGITFEKKDFEGKSGIHWYTDIADANGEYRDRRWGQIDLGTAYSMSGYETLDLEFYYDYTDTPGLSYIFIKLLDGSGNVVSVTGSHKGYPGFANRTVGSVTMGNKQWISISLDLDDLLQENLVDPTVRYIQLGYDYPRDVYFSNISFQPEQVVDNTTVGFVLPQDQIPDYGSATSGNLVIPVNAVYTSSDNSTYRIGSSGTFVLHDEESVTFSDQFRRGSYMYLEEQASYLYDTTWKMYEGTNEKLVTSSAVPSTATTVTGTAKAMPGTDTRIVTDGRVENIGTVTGETSGTNKYQSTGTAASPSPGNTFVFRHYTDPDNTSVTTKLKVVYTNTIKTGTLTITKAQATSSQEDLGDQEFTFYVVFHNVGGMSLESAPIVYGPFTLTKGQSKEITGIPLGTWYKIHEVKAKDNNGNDIILENVSYDLKAYGKGTMLPTSDTLTVGSTKHNTYSVEGLIPATGGDGSKVTFTFNNSKKSVVDLTVKKVWSTTGTVTLPTSIYVQLQSRTNGENWTAVKDYKKVQLAPGYNESWDDFTYTFENLDKYVPDTNNETEYQYRVVELDGSNVIDADGTVTIGGVEFKVSYGESGKASNAKDESGIDIENQLTQTITNTVIPTVKLEITKLDATTKDKLAGVEFKLEKDGSTIGTRTTGTDGIATFEGLKAGTYKLTETKAKSGYSLLKSSIEIVITEKTDATTGAITYTAKVNDSDADSFEPGEGTNVYTLAMTVYNKQGLTMPSTGGVYGFEYWILGGLCITAVPLLLYTLFGFKKGGKYRRR